MRQGRKKMNIREFEPLTIIGRGAFGEVRVCRQKSNGDIVAIKKMRKDITSKELLRTVHDKVPSYISFLLMMKLNFTENIFFYLISYFLRFLGILILCGNFYLTQKDVEENESLAYYLRFLTSHYFMKRLKITNFKDRKSVV